MSWMLRSRSSRASWSVRTRASVTTWTRTTRTSRARSRTSHCRSPARTTIHTNAGPAGDVSPPPAPHRRRPSMTLAKRAIATTLVAVAVFVLGASGAFRILRPDDPRGVAAPEALAAPIAMTGSLEQTIADLQTHLAAQPDDAHALATLGLAYSQEAMHTADPSYYPKAEEALQRSLAIEPSDNVDAIVGM